jgi:prevent-host-death family protein
MTLQGAETEVGVRELHDRLSEYLERVEQGAEVLVTRRGKPIARLSQVEGPRPLEDLDRRGLVQWPKRPRQPREPLAGAQGSVSDLVKEQRR